VNRELDPFPSGGPSVADHSGISDLTAQVIVSGSASTLTRFRPGAPDLWAGGARGNDESAGKSRRSIGCAGALA